MLQNIRSHVGAIAKKAKRIVSAENYSTYDEEENTINNKLDDMHFISHQEVYALQDRKEDIELVLKYIENDDVCHLVFLCAQEGYGIQETAEYLGMKVSEINNAIRRIKYKVPDALKTRKE